MRYVERDRIAPPSIFASEEARASRRDVLDLFMSSRDRLAQSRLERSHSFSDHPKLQQALAELFSRCCAFCETPLEKPLIYRFRPTQGAHPIGDEQWGHLYYSWLADAWQNLYPICRDCLPEDPFHFPVTGGRRSSLPNPAQIQEYIDRDDGRWPFFPLDETSLLIDPCYDRKLWRHLRFSSDGRVTAHNDDRRGRATIRHFHLDRQELTKARAIAFEHHFRELADMLSMPEGEETYYTGTSGPYRGAWYLHLRQLLAEALDRSPSEDVERMAKSLRGHSDWWDRLHQARHRLQTIDEPIHSLRGPHPPGEPREPRSIIIRNFKSLEHVSIELPLDTSRAERQGAALLILGENAAGKSSILEAVAIALMPPKVRSLLKLRGGKYVLNPHYLGAEDAPFPEKAVIELGYEAGDRQALIIAPTYPASAKRHFAADFNDYGVGNPLPLFAYGAYRQFLEKERGSTPHKYVRTMFQTHEVLSNPEKWLLRLKASDFNMVARALRAVFSIEAEFEVLERRDGAVFVKQQIGTPEAPRWQHTPIGIVSSGFRAVLAMLCDILRGLMDKKVNPHFKSLETARGLVLVDEIEAHLHPRWKMAIMRGLRQALPQVTFIATSHDPLCLRGMNPNEVVVLERIPGEQADTNLPIFTQTLIDLPDNKHWTIEQLLTADFFQLRSTADVEAERRMARMQDKLAAGIRPDEDAELEVYLAEISSTLPIGDTEVHRLVQAAVAKFLAEQRQATRERLKSLKDKTRNDIAAALRGAA